MAGAATDLYDLCVELLEAAAAAVALAPAGPIGRRFISPGLPAIDCPEGQLSVHAGGPAQADTLPVSPILQPAHRVGQAGVVNLAQMTITVIRCTPVIRDEGGTITWPSAAALTASAAEILADVWAIWNHLSTLKRAGLLFAPLEREVYYDPAIALPTAGGTAGWEIPVRVQLGGYRTIT